MRHINSPPVSRPYETFVFSAPHACAYEIMEKSTRLRRLLLLLQTYIYARMHTPRAFPKTPRTEVLLFIMLPEAMFKRARVRVCICACVRMAVIFCRLVAAGQKGLCFPNLISLSDPMICVTSCAAYKYKWKYYVFAVVIAARVGKQFATARSILPAVSENYTQYAL